MSYKYRVEEIPNGKEHIKFLNKMSKEDWELVTITESGYTNCIGHFKRWINPLKNMGSFKLRG